jgi:hypothetical protein
MIEASIFWPKYCTAHRLKYTHFSYLVIIISQVMEGRRGKGTHLLLTTAVFSTGRRGDIKLYSTISIVHIMNKKTGCRETKRTVIHYGDSVVPSLFDGCNKIRSREHGEQAVPIG